MIWLTEFALLEIRLAISQYNLAGFSNVAAAPVH
jgi:hypothetical protein